MAFTRAPVNDTHNVVRIQPSGEAFLVNNQGNAVLPPTLNYVDCFPLSEKQWGGEKKMGVHKREAWQSASVATGSVTTAGVLGRSLVMAPDVDSYPNVFFAKQGTYYMYNYNTNTITSVTTSTVAAAAQYASGTMAVDNTNVKRVCFLDGSDELKTFLQDGTSVTTTTTGRSLDGQRGLVFLNGYLFAVNNTGYYIYNSSPGGVLTTWNSTDFLAAEQYADPIVWIDKHKNYLVAFGTQSTEFFYDAGIEVGSPLARQENYSRQIGLYTTGALPGKFTARIGDDLYFLGVKEGDSVGLFRIRNFQIEEIENQWVSGVLNTVYSEPKVDVAGGIETMIINNNPMVVINIKDENYCLVYLPSEDTWWQMSQTGDFSDVQYRLGTQWFSNERGYPIFLSQTATTASAVSYNIPDYDGSSISSCQFYTPVVDFGINYWKHFARVDVVGDFGANDVSLNFNITPNYSQSYTSCLPATRNPATDGFQNAASWYNLGYGRRVSFLVTMNGTGHAICNGIDVEYNAGAA